MVLLLLAITAQTNRVSAQETQRTFDGLATGISIEGGVSLAGLKDDFISNQKYSGSSGYLRLSWSSSLGKSLFEVSMESLVAPSLSNNNLSTAFGSGSLSGALLFPLRPFSVAGRTGTLFVGPTWGFSLYLGKLDLSEGSFLNETASLTLLAPLGVRAGGVLGVSPRIHVEGWVGSSILTATLRSVDVVDDAGVAGGVLPFWSTQQVNGDLAARFQVSEKVEARLGYRMRLLRAQEWNPLLMVSDGLHLGVTIGF